MATDIIKFEGIEWIVESYYAPAQPRQGMCPPEKEEFMVEGVKFPNGSDAELYVTERLTKELGEIILAGIRENKWNRRVA